MRLFVPPGQYVSPPLGPITIPKYYIFQKVVPCRANKGSQQKTRNIGVANPIQSIRSTRGLHFPSIHDLFMVFSKNWISKNWKSIGIHCWTSINDIHYGPSMIIIDGPSMNMVRFLWAPFFEPLLWVPFLWAPWGPIALVQLRAFDHRT